MNNPQTLRFTRRHLPHWIVADATFFVTLRIAGSLPKIVVDELTAERPSLLEETPHTDERYRDLLRRQFARIETILDAQDSDTRHWLTAKGLPPIILENLPWLVDRGWNIHAAVVMGTHLHALMRNTIGRNASLREDMAHYKRFVAREVNRQLNRTGEFWAREDFDHWCRSPEKVAGAVRYIAQNPVKAGLVTHWHEWPWTVIAPAWQQTLGYVRSAPQSRTYR